MKQFRRFRSFVRLEVADQVPTGFAKVAQISDLAGKFLDPVFAEMTDASLICVANAVCRESLADRHKRDYCRVTPGARGCCLDSFAYSDDVLGNRHKGANHEGHKVTRRKSSCLAVSFVCLR